MRINNSGDSLPNRVLGLTAKCIFCAGTFAFASDPRDDRHGVDATVAVQASHRWGQDPAQFTI